jgi:hypothetical protein
MSRTRNDRRFPATKITLGRAARLHRLVGLLTRGPSRRETILHELGIGLRTFYRELKALRRCGIEVQQKSRIYTLRTTAEPVEGLLPFPDPQLNFAEMIELSRCPSQAGRRLAQILDRVLGYREAAPARGEPRGPQSGPPQAP